MRAILRAASRGLDILGDFRDGYIKHLYKGDNLRIYGRNLSFMSDERFIEAYRAGMKSGHHIGRPKGSEVDIHVEFRAYIECWAASQGLRLQGDFVFCGVNTGIFPIAVCKYTNINQTNKNVWLFDTYNGIPKDQMSLKEIEVRPQDNKNYYSECLEIAKNNFAPFLGARLVQGKVPDTLRSVSIDKVAYLSIDMNIAYPERKSIEYFWPKLSYGAFVVLDDYGFISYPEQKKTMDEFAASVGTEILTLPTGQGMLIKS